jgi:hypothetical protein
MLWSRVETASGLEKDRHREGVVNKMTIENRYGPITPTTLAKRDGGIAHLPRRGPKFKPQYHQILYICNY